MLNVSRNINTTHTHWQRTIPTDMFLTITWTRFNSYNKQKDSRSFRFWKSSKSRQWKSSKNCARGCSGHTQETVVTDIQKLSVDLCLTWWRHVQDFTSLHHITDEHRTQVDHTLDTLIQKLQTWSLESRIVQRVVSSDNQWLILRSPG